MKALVVLSAVIAVVLSAPSVNNRYTRPGAYPWQQNRYYNSYTPVRNVYSSPRWYQSTIAPVKYEVSTLSPWQGKAKFSFGSAIASTPAVVVQPEAEQKVTIVESVPAVPKVPAGFGAFHFGKKSTPVVVTKEEIKPVEIITPEIKISKTVVESSGSAESSLTSISNEESAQALKNVEVTVSDKVKPLVVETVSVQSLPETKSSTGTLVEGSEQSQLIVTETLKKVDVEESNEKVNKTLLVEEPKPLSIVENQSISEIKSEVIAPVVVKKKHGFSFSYNPNTNVYNRNALQFYSQAQPSAAPLPVIKPQSVVVTIQPIELKPTLQPDIVESEKTTIVPASSTIEALQATTENILSTNEYVVPTIDISQPVIQYASPSVENKLVTLEDIPSTIEYAVPTLDISQPIIQYQESSAPSEQYASTVEDVVPTADINQPIIQYGSYSEENAPTTVESSQTTTESSSATSDYASEYSPINSESIDALLSTLEPTIEPVQSEIKQETYEYLSTEVEATSTEKAPATTESAGNEYLQNDFEPALTTIQSQIANIEFVPAIESSSPLVSELLTSSVQNEPAAAVSSQSLSYSSTPSIVKKKHGFSFSYNPSGYVYNREASFAYKPNSEVAAPEIKVVPAVTTLAPSTVQYLQPVVSTVVPAANIWSNSYNAKKNGFSFSFNPSFSYFNKQPYYQQQVAVPAPAVISSVSSATPVVSSPSVIQSSSSHLELAPLTIESTPATPEYVESTTAFFENSSEDAQTITTESSLSETTPLNIEYGTTEPEEKTTIVLEPTTQSAVVQSLNVAVESLSLTDKAPATPALISSSFAVPPVAPQVLPAANAWSNTYSAKKHGFSFSSLPSFSYFNKPAYQPQIAVNVPATASISSVSYVSPIATSPESSAAAIESSLSSVEISPISAGSAPLVPEVAESTTALNEIATDNAEFESFTTESYSDETTTLAIESGEYLSTTQTTSTGVASVSAAIESSIKEALNGQLAIASISKETVPVVIEIKPAAIKSENITQSLSVTSSSSVGLESASVSSPVLINSAPVAVASVQAIPVPLYVKEVTKVSPPTAFPAFQPSFVTKKHGFSFSYKPSGNYYKKPEVIAPAIVESSPVIASVAPAIVESSPVIASVAPAIVESSPVIASVAPTIVESSPVTASVAPAIVESSPVIASVAPALVESSQEVATRPSIFLSIVNAVKSAILNEDTNEKSAEVKPEISLSPSVAAESQKLNEAEVSSQYDIAVKASPISPKIKEEVEYIHDLRLGN